MTPAALSVRDLSWAPPGIPSIIRAISFDVAPREVVAIVGANGAGKSTLLRCLYRVYRPSAGVVSIDGQDVWRLTPRAVARRIAAVPQEAPAAFPFKVRDIVAMGRTPHRRGLFDWSAGDPAHLDAAMRRFDIAGLAERTYASLSGGERQRVLLARAVAQQPGAVILDEPTSHLDVRYQLETLAFLRQLDVTVVTTLHDLNLAASIADRVLVLSHGAAVGIGTPEEMLTARVVRDAFGVGSLVDRHPVTGAPRFSFYLERGGAEAVETRSTDWSDRR